MKLAVLYTVWNGLELLDGSIQQINNDVDTIVIGWQGVSHHGKKSEEVEPFVRKLKRKYKKVVLFEFKPRGGDAKGEERRKHNQMIKVAQNESCTHFFFSATDHYYETEQFKAAKIKATQYDATASKMYTYFKKPEWRLDPIESYYMPFICKLKVNMTYCRDTGGKWNVYVDPALCIVPNDSFYEFTESELMMHHYSFVRKDISGKLKNAAARVNFNDKIENIIKGYESYDGSGIVPYYPDHQIKKADNLFKISL